MIAINKIIFFCSISSVIVTFYRKFSVQGDSKLKFYKNTIRFENFNFAKRSNFIYVYKKNIFIII